MPLGVRYVLSDCDIPQYEKLTDYATGKNVYLNPYCLPCGFIADYDIDEPEDSSDPFEYTNSMYSAMTGDKCRVYKACDYENKRKRRCDDLYGSSAGRRRRLIR